MLSSTQAAAMWPKDQGRHLGNHCRSASGPVNERHCHLREASISERLRVE